MDQVYPVHSLRSAVLGHDCRPEDRRPWTVDCGRMPLRDDVSCDLEQPGCAAIDVFMIMRRLVLESSTIKKRMLIS